MKRALPCCAVLLACLMAIVSPAAVWSSATTVGGAIPLAVSQVAASNITGSSAVISWQTNGPSTSQVFYDTVWHEDLADYAHHVESDSLVSIHSLSLSGLSSGTSYYYVVKSVLTDNGNSLTAVEDNYLFTTLTPGTSVTISSPPNGHLPGGCVGVAYSHALAAFGGTPAYTWCVLSGSLPSGLSLDASTGVISGTPTEAGMYKFTIQVKDTAGATATAALRIKVSAGPDVCSDSLPSGEASVWQVLTQGVEVLVSIPGSLISGLLA